MKYNTNTIARATTTASILATVSAAHGSIVFINLPENTVNHTDDANQSNAFSFGDVSFAGSTASTGAFNGNAFNSGGSIKFAELRYYGAGTVGSAVFNTSFTSSNFAYAGTNPRNGGAYSSATATVNGFIFVQFTQPQVNGSTPTNGLLEIQSFFDNPNQIARVSILDLYFDDANPNATRAEIEAGVDSANEFDPAPVPEPSSLALLALGATGLLARRRRQAS